MENDNLSFRCYDGYKWFLDFLVFTFQNWYVLVPLWFSAVYIFFWTVKIQVD